MQRSLIFVSALFTFSDCLAILSLSGSDWISSNSGDVNLGLIWTCVTIHNKPEICFTPNLCYEWLLTLTCIFLGCVCITTTIILTIWSHWDRSILLYAKWVGFTAMVLFCLATIAFPMGFYIDEIGGESFNLPANFDVGHSFRLFNYALWFTIVSEIVAGKIWLPLL